MKPTIVGDDLDSIILPDTYTAAEKKKLDPHQTHVKIRYRRVGRPEINTDGAIEYVIHF